MEGSFQVDGVPCTPAFQLLKAHLRKYTPESVAEITTIPAHTIRRHIGKPIAHRPVRVVRRRIVDHLHHHTRHHRRCGNLQPELLGQPPRHRDQRDDRAEKRKHSADRQPVQRRRLPLRRRAQPPARAPRTRRVDKLRHGRRRVESSWERWGQHAPSVASHPPATSPIRAPAATLSTHPLRHRSHSSFRPHFASVEGAKSQSLQAHGPSPRLGVSARDQGSFPHKAHRLKPPRVTAGLQKLAYTF